MMKKNMSKNVIVAIMDVLKLIYLDQVFLVVLIYDILKIVILMKSLKGMNKMMKIVEKQ